MNDHDQSGKDRIRPHTVDGIQEYDNDLPTWWVWLFWGAIVYGIGYLIYFHFAGGQSIDQEFQAKMAELAEAQNIAHEASESTDAEGSEHSAGSEAQDWHTNPKSIAEGKELYIVNCIGCHGANGEGGIGPNLTDNFFIHGNSPAELLNIVTNGALEKGMPGWGPVLGVTKVRQATAYVYSLIGSHAANGKAPQGVEHKP